MSLLKEVTMFGEAYMKGQISYSTYCNLVDMAIEWYKIDKAHI